MHSLSGRVLAAVVSSMIAFIPYPVSARDDGRYHQFSAQAVV